MRALIICYSRTGNTWKAAIQLAETLKADLTEIHCDHHRKGLWRYWRTAYESVKGVMPDIEMADLEADAYDLAVIAGPIWTSHPALPLRAWLARKPALPRRTAVLFTHIGNDPTRAFTELDALLPAPSLEKLALTGEDVRKDRIGRDIDAFARRLRLLAPDAQTLTPIDKSAA